MGFVLAILTSHFETQRKLLCKVKGLFHSGWLCPRFLSFPKCCEGSNWKYAQAISMSCWFFEQELRSSGTSIFLIKAHRVSMCICSFSFVGAIELLAIWIWHWFRALLSTINEQAHGDSTLKSSIFDTLLHSILRIWFTAFSRCPTRRLRVSSGLVVELQSQSFDVKLRKLCDSIQ